MRQSITLLSLLLLTHLAPARAWRDFNPDIARVSAAGGGTVVVRAGEWETGPIHLKSNVELHFEDGADVLFTDDLEKYLPAVEISWEGVECLNWSPLVYANGATNVAVTGSARPADFDRFWADAKAKYDREVPVDVKLEKVGSLSDAEEDVFKVTVTSPPG